MEVVNRQKLETAAAMRPTPPPHQKTRFSQGHNGYREFDLEAWIGEHGVLVKREGPWGRDGYRWVLEECPWNGHTDNAAYIVRFASGAVAAGCHHNSCQGLGWRDLREHYEPNAYDRHEDARETGSYSSEANSANSANSANGYQDSNGGPEPWSPPAAFHSFELPGFPRDVFPGWVEKYVRALAEATQTPPDLPGMLALSVGAAAGAKVVEVEIWEGWREPLNLFTATGLRPGSRKTTVFQRMCAPLEAREAQLIEDTAPEIAEQRTRHKIHEERLKKAQAKAAKSEGDELDTLTADAMQAASDLESIKVLAQPRLLVDDASRERLTTLLADQGGRIALMSPEGGVFDMMAGRYSQGVPNLDVYLKGHAEDALRVDRVGRPSDYVQNPALTIGLAVQPDVLRGLANKPGFRGRGLLGRFLYAMPRDTLGKRTIRPKAVPCRVEDSYDARVTKLLELSPDLPEGERQGKLRYSSGRCSAS